MKEARAIRLSKTNVSLRTSKGRLRLQSLAPPEEPLLLYQLIVSTNIYKAVPQEV